MAAAAAKLSERVGPAANLLRLFGLGLRPADGGGGRYGTADALWLLVNGAFCAFGFVHITMAIPLRMPLMWDVSTVMSVVRVYTYVLSPPVTVAAWQWHGRGVADALRALDEAVAACDAGGGDPDAVPPLRPYAVRAATWYALSVLLEYLAYTVFHVGTDFAYFSPYEYCMIAVYNVWTVAPVFAYYALVDAARLVVRRLNGRVDTVAAWRRHRGPWKRLARTAARLARREFGPVLAVFVLRTVAEVVFYVFSVHYAAYPFRHAQAIRHVTFGTTAVMIACRVFEVFRVSQNCKLEILKTQRILSSVTFKTKSDYKELQYFSLYMLHMDFNFMPCGIFDLNYRCFVTMATLTAAFSVFQIQMKLH